MENEIQTIIEATLPTRVTISDGCGILKSLQLYEKKGKVAI